MVTQVGGESRPQGWSVCGASGSKCPQKGQVLGSLAEPARIGCIKGERGDMISELSCEGPHNLARRPGKEQAFFFNYVQQGHMLKNSLK